MRREQSYAKVVRSAEFADARIELIVVHHDAHAMIRFGDWQGGILNRRPLDLRENELLKLLGDAIAAGIFSCRFQHELYGVLEAQAGARAMTDGELTAIFDQITHDWPVAGWQASRGARIDSLKAARGASAGAATAAVRVMGRGSLMPEKLPRDASLRSVVPTLPKPRAYFANVYQLMRKMPAGTEHVLARIGVTGIGIMPNFRLETTGGTFKQAYDGVTFKPFPEPKTHDGNWSTHASTFAEVEALVTEQAAKAKGKKL